MPHTTRCSRKGVRRERLVFGALSRARFLTVSLRFVVGFAACRAFRIQPNRQAVACLLYTSMWAPTAVHGGFNADLVSEIKRAVHVPVIAVGRFTDPYYAEDVYKRQGIWFLLHSTMLQPFPM